MIANNTRLDKIFLIMFSLMLAIFFVIILPVEAVSAETMMVDPFPPNPHEGVAYTMKVPSLQNRLTRNAETQVTTLFAPNTSRSAGWYDANKIFPQDSQLCWAASDSNVIAWYLDYMKHIGMDVTLYDTALNDVFNHFRDNWKREGYDPLMGLSWYFTSKFPMGDYPQNLINQGGYLRDVRGNTPEGWFNLYPGNGKFVFGNYADKFPFVQDIAGHYYENDPLYTHESFSSHIIEQLHYGAVVLSIAKENSGGASHAITLWGVDIDEKGLVTNMYVTDSDDSVTAMVEIPVKKRPGNVGGVLIKMQPGLGLGDASPYTRVIASTVLYAPNVINAIEESEPIPPCVHEYVNGNDSMHHYEECIKCGEIRGKEPHAFGGWVVDTVATCTAVGKEYRTCKCGYTENREIEKLPHKYVDKHDSTHHYKECSVCHTIIDKTPHAFSGWVVDTEPTVESEGKKHRVCDCGYVEYVTIDRLIPPNPEGEIDKPDGENDNIEEQEGDSEDGNTVIPDANVSKGEMSMTTKLAIALPSIVIPIVITVVIVIIIKKKNK